MALPSSGQITLAQIRDEFGAGTTSNVSLRTLSAAAGLSTPDAFSDFYGLSSWTAPTYTTTYGGATPSVSGSGTTPDPYIFEFGDFSIVEDYDFYDWDSCCGCFYLKKYAIVTMRFQNNFAGSQRARVYVDSVGNRNSRPICDFEDMTYVSTEGVFVSETSTRGDSARRIRNRTDRLGDPFTKAVGDDIYATFYTETIVEQSEDFQLRNLTLEVNFEPA